MWYSSFKSLESRSWKYHWPFLHFASIKIPKWDNYPCAKWERCPSITKHWNRGKDIALVEDKIKQYLTFFVHKNIWSKKKHSYSTERAKNWKPGIKGPYPVRFPSVLNAEINRNSSLHFPFFLFSAAIIVFIFFTFP